MNDLPHAPALLAPRDAARLAAEAEELSRGVVDFVRHRRGRLAGVRVAAPVDRRWAGFGRLVAARLAARGYADVSVQVEVGDRFRVVSVELDR